MDKQGLAVKCFVFATRPHIYHDPIRRTLWLVRGLRLWQEATGQDMAQEIENVKRKGGEG